MNDKKALERAAAIRAKFWDDYEAELTPEKCSKQAYLEELEELGVDLEGRMEAVREEIAAEEA